jgi:hypothetical protein
MLKPLVIGAAALALLSAPALAQRYDPDAGSGNIVQGPGGAPVTADTPPYVGQRSGRAYDYDRPYTTGMGHHKHKKKRRTTR